MLKMRYIGLKTEYDAGFKKISDHIVQLLGNFPVKEKGFQLSRAGMEDWDKMDYTGFTTIYRVIEGGVQFSDDGSVYVSPKLITTFLAGSGGTIEGTLEQEVSDYSELVIPVSAPDENYRFANWSPEIPDSGEVTVSRTFTAIFEYVPTLEEVKASKVEEVHEAQQAAINQGIDVTLTDGTVEHFTLKGQDQTSLTGLQIKVAQGDDRIPWHTSDIEEHCKYYSNANMSLIATAAMQYVTFHVTYFRDLRIYINAMDNKESVEAVTYGIIIPEKYRSEVLKDLYAAMGV